MIRPFTCICLALAAGSGLYLYQVKQRAFTLDAELRSTFNDIDMARDKTRMLRADWALMNDPERLQTLASQYLTLQPMAPSQLMTLEQLAASLPPPVPPQSTPAVSPPAQSTPAAAPHQAMPVPGPAEGQPMASAAPASPAVVSSGPAVAMLQPGSADPASAPAAAAPATAVASDAAGPGGAAAEASPAAVTPAAATPAPVATLAPARIEPTVAAVTPHVTHRWIRRVELTKPRAGHVEAPRPWTPPGSVLAYAGVPVPPVPKAHHAHHMPEALQPSTQFFAANEVPRAAAYGGERITPPAATVMYSPGRLLAWHGLRRRPGAAAAPLFNVTVSWGDRDRRAPARHHAEPSLGAAAAQWRRSSW